MNSDTNIHKHTRELVALRRSKVLDLMAQSVPQHEIAKQLGVSHATISLDQQYLRCAAQQNIKTHIEERIPAQFEECQAGLKLILRKTYEIVDNKSKRTEEQLAAMNLAVNIYGKLMDLSTNGAILEKTVKWLEERKKILPTPEEQKQIDKILGETSTEGDADTSTEKEEDLQEQEKE